MEQEDIEKLMKALGGASSSQEETPEVSVGNMTEDEFAQYLQGRKAAEIKALTGARESILGRSDQLGTLRKGQRATERMIENEEKIGEAFGVGDVFFKGVSENEGDQNLMQRAISATTSFFDQGEADVRSAKSFLISKDYMNAYDGLRGGGHISNFEGQMAANAQSELKSKTIPDDQAKEMIRRMDRSYRYGIHRMEHVPPIKIRPLDQKEYLIDPETGKVTDQQVVTYEVFDENGNPTREIKTERVPAGTEIVNIPSFASEELVKEMYNKLPVGGIYIYKGRSFKKSKK